jgi:hypothetical protein
METLELSKPLKTLSGDTVQSLSFDFDGLKPMDYRNIVRLEARLKGVNFDAEAFNIKATSSEFRMATAWIAAVNNKDNKICLDDIDNISFSDLLQLERIGLFFIMHVE